MAKTAKNTTIPTRKTKKSRPISAKPEHIDAVAEDFEHKLKRLVVEREKKRSKNFGMYKF